MAVVPIADDDLVQGTVKYLKSKSEIVNVVSATPSGQPWIFQDTIMETMDKGLSTALVVADGGSWASVNLHNTARFKRVRIEIWAGAELDAGGSVISPQEPRRRVEHVFRILDRIMFRPYNKVVYFGDVQTRLCDRQGDLSIYSVEDSEATIKGECFYGIEF